MAKKNMITPEEAAKLKPVVPDNGVVQDEVEETPEPDQSSDPVRSTAVKTPKAGAFSAGIADIAGPNLKDPVQFKEDKKSIIRVKVNSVEYSEADVVKLIKSNVTVLFDGEAFLELSDEAIEQLGFESKRDYMLAREEFKARKDRSRKEAEGLIGDIKVSLNPNIVGSMAKARTKMTPPKGIHATLQPPEYVEAFKEAGYIQKGTKTTIDGKTELVEMWCPESDYLERLHATADLSTQRVRGVESSFRGEISRIHPKKEGRVEATGHVTFSKGKVGGGYIVDDGDED